MAKTSATAKGILVAQDGSAAAQAAAEVAVELARREHLPVRGIYIVDERLVMEEFANYNAELGNVELPSSRAELVTRFRAQGEVALLWLKAHGEAAGVSVSTELLFGGVSDLVLRDSAHAQIVALGRRGHGHAGDLAALGQNFQRIAQNANVPLLIGGEKEPQSIHRVLLAYDDSERAQDALGLVVQLQKPLALDVWVLAVKEDDEQFQLWLSEIQALVRSSGLAHYRWIARAGHPAAEITAAATEAHADMIAMGGYAHGPLLEWITGSTLDRVLRQTQLPVLVA